MSSLGHLGCRTAGRYGLNPSHEKQYDEDDHDDTDNPDAAVAVAVPVAAETTTESAEQKNNEDNG